LFVFERKNCWPIAAGDGEASTIKATANTSETRIIV
jgi:hypothetical protein